MDYVGRGIERGVVQVGRWSMGVISSQIANASNFAQEYDGYMTEIQMVTLKTDAQMDRVSAGLQETANKLGLSLIDVASSAVTFYRMGFSDQEVNDRLMWVSKFAKVANVDFSSAAKMMVTVSNSMADDIQGNMQRVSDVLLYLGDNSATTASDVAEAMQSLGPIANAIGIPFERIASMTAALSDKTQQSASRIATGLRSTIMRLYAVRNSQIDVFKDFAEDGEMEELWEINNDPAKLMNTLGDLGVKLQDANGQWRDFYDIMKDVSTVWSSLAETDPKRSAIMNILGGQRAGVYVGALLDSLASDTGKVDMLYGGAMGAYGSTETKYNIWTQSAAAAQERYNAALQNMYSLLDVQVVIDFYNAMATIGNNTAIATKNLVGMNLIFPAIVAGCIAVSAAATKAGMTTLTFGNIMTLVRTAMANHPILAAATIFLALATTVSVAAGAIIKATEASRKAQIEQYNTAIDVANKAQQKIQTFSNLRTEMNKMFSSSADVTQELQKYNGTLESLAKVSPTAAYVVDQLKKGLIDQKEAARLLNEELDKTIEREQSISVSSNQTALRNKTVSEATANLKDPWDGGTSWDRSMTKRSSVYADLIDPNDPIGSLKSLESYYEGYN